MGTWMREALCLGIDNPDAFFPSNQGNPLYHIPRAVCGGCPVRIDCLEYELAAMLADPEYSSHGMFGGTTPPERARIVAGRRLVAA